MLISAEEDSRQCTYLRNLKKKKAKKRDFSVQFQGAGGSRNREPPGIYL
jgi:hypothetical protein